MYFYKNATSNLFYIGDDILPAGKYLLKVYNNATDVAIESATRYKVIMKPVAITKLRRENNTYYANLTELLADVKDFFKEGYAEDITALDTRVTNLENTTFRIIYYENITTSSGSVTVPQGATIIFDYWEGGLDALVSETTNGEPNFEDGGIIVDSFNSDGDYVLSGGIPSDPASLIYVFSISLLDYEALDKNYIIDQIETPGTGATGGTGIPVYISLINITQSEGDLHFTGLNWGVSKSAIKNIKVVTTSSNWDLYILQNDNGYATDDALIPAKTLMIGGNLTEEISMDYAYEDEDSSLSLHLYWVDNSGTNTADFYISGFEME